ncbi:hypothetical protein [Marinomonas sp. 2405UD68-3]|uniref:hypothetical protein n=1 Tax=Marinomonas sp. 2405UD68-3 TaxID=3391835 RepID=UPI0039C94555
MNKAKLTSLAFCVATTMLCSSSYTVAAPNDSNSKTVIKQLKDPIGTDKQRLENSKDLIRRVMQNQKHELNLSDVTQDVVNGLPDISTAEMSDLSVQLVNKGLESEQGIDELIRTATYFTSVETVLTGMTKVVKASADLQKARDELNESLEAGTLLDQMKKRIEAQDATIIKQQTMINELNSFFQSTNENFEYLKASLIQTQKVLKVVSEREQGPLELPQNVQTEPSLKEVPFDIISTAVIRDPVSLKIVRASAQIKYRGQSEHIEIEQGSTFSNWKVITISENVTELLNISTNKKKFLRTGFPA